MFKISPTRITIAAVLCASLATIPAHGQLPAKTVNAPQDPETILQDILNRATAARDNAADARDRAQEVRDEMHADLQMLTTQMRSFIHDWVNEATRIIDEQTEGRDAWINGSGCGNFRTDIIAMLQNMQTIFNQLNLIADPIATPISFDDEIQLVNRLDCKVLYSLYLVMNATNAFGAHMVNLLQEGAAGLQTIGGIVAGTYENRPGSIIDYAVGQPVNQFILINPTVVDNATHTVKALGIVLKIVGKRLKAKGKSGVDTLQVEIWGWVGLTLKTDQVAKWGEILVGLSELLDKAAETADMKLDNAILLGSLKEIRDNQTRILANERWILKLLRHQNQ